MVNFMFIIFTTIKNKDFFSSKQTLYGFLSHSEDSHRCSPVLTSYFLGLQEGIQVLWGLSLYNLEDFLRAVIQSYA